MNEFFYHGIPQDEMIDLKQRAVLLKKAGAGDAAALAELNRRYGVTRVVSYREKPKRRRKKEKCKPEPQA